MSLNHFLSSTTQGKRNAVTDGVPSLSPHCLTRENVTAVHGGPKRDRYSLDCKNALMIWLYLPSLPSGFVLSSMLSQKLNPSKLLSGGAFGSLRRNPS